MAPGWLPWLAEKLVSVKFVPDEDIPDQSGRVFIVTGANTGLGLECCLQIAKHNPSHIFLAARTQSKADAAIATIKETVPDAKVTFLELDLMSFTSIKKAADSFLAQSDRLDVLMNNAGVMSDPAGQSQDGYEKMFGTNHMGHALFIKLLMPVLLKTAEEPGADVRIITLSSDMYAMPPSGGLLLDLCTTDMKAYLVYTKYGQSKLANLLYAAELAERYPSVKTIAAHPGTVETQMTTELAASSLLLRMFYTTGLGPTMVSVEQGSLSQLWATFSGDASTGQFYYPVGIPHDGSSYSRDKKLAEKLWDWTEKEFAKHGY